MGGIAESLLLVFFCGLCTFLTSISLSAIATNGAMKVQSYSLIILCFLICISCLGSIVLLVLLDQFACKDLVEDQIFGFSDFRFLALNLFHIRFRISPAAGRISMRELMLIVIMHLQSTVHL